MGLSLALAEMTRAYGVVRAASTSGQSLGMHRTATPSTATGVLTVHSTEHQ